MRRLFVGLQWAFILAVALSPLFILIVMMQHGFTLQVPELPEIARTARRPGVIPEWLFWTTTAALGIPVILALVSEYRNAGRTKSEN